MKNVVFSVQCLPGTRYLTWYWYQVCMCGVVFSVMLPGTSTATVDLPGVIFTNT